MHRRLAEVISYTEAARIDLLGLVSPLAPEAWEMRAPDGGWSVREVVAHLHLVEDSCVRALFRTFRAARDAGLGPETEITSVLSSLDAAGLPQARTRIVAPPFVTPSDPPSPEELLGKLEHSRNGLRQWSLEADGFALGEIKFPHQVLGPLDLYQWALFVGQHERRHIAQLLRILRPHGESPFANPASIAADAGTRYTAALLGVLGEREPLGVWAQLPNAIDELTRHVTPEQAVVPERPGKWSIVQVVSHLVDTEAVYAYRMRLIVAEASPAIFGYDQDLWAQRLHYEKESLDTLRNELRVARGRNLRFVRSLSETERARVGLHNERGPESVWHTVKLIAAHDLVHRNQITRIKAALGIR